MDLSTSVLLGLVALMAINQFVMRVQSLFERDLVFFSVQIINTTVGSAVLINGLPGFGHIPAISWMVGLLFVLHVATNLNARAKRARHSRKDEMAEIQAESKRLKASRAPDEDY